MESPTPTPTPRKPRKHNKGSERPDQREPVPALQSDDEEDRDAVSDEELMDLLGIPGSDLPKKGGILSISRADIAESKKGRRGSRKTAVDDGAGIVTSEASQADRRTPRKRGAKKAHTVEKGFEVTEPVAGTASRSAGTPNRKGKGSNTQAVPGASVLASTLAAHKSGRSASKLDDSDLAHFDINSNPYDLAILSRSLPHQDYQMPWAAESEAGESIGERRSEAWDSPGKVAAETPNVNSLVFSIRDYANNLSGSRSYTPGVRRCAKRLEDPSARLERHLAHSSPLLSIHLDPNMIVGHQLTVSPFALSHSRQNRLHLSPHPLLIRTGPTILAST